MINEITILHHIFLPRKLVDTFNGLNKLAVQGKRKSIKNFSDLEINNVIQFENLKELAKAAIENPHRVYLVHYDFGPHICFTEGYFRSIYSSNEKTEKINDTVKNIIKFHLDDLDKNLDRIIPGYSQMTPKRKVNSVLSELDSIISWFITILRHEEINNIHFVKLSDISKELADQAMTALTCQGGIDGIKNELLRNYSSLCVKDSDCTKEMRSVKDMLKKKFEVVLTPKTKLNMRDFDSLNYHALTESLNRVTCNVQFSVSKEETKYQMFGNDQGYVMCYSAVSCLGRDGYKFFALTSELSKFYKENCDERRFKVKYKGTKLNWDPSTLGCFAISILRNGDIDQLNEKGLAYTKEEWMKLCKSHNVKPFDQKEGMSWDLNLEHLGYERDLMAKEAEKKLLSNDNIWDFIIECKSIRNAFIENLDMKAVVDVETSSIKMQIPLTPSYLQFFLLETLKLSNQQKNLVK